MFTYFQDFVSGELYGNKREEKYQTQYQGAMRK